MAAVIPQKEVETMIASPPPIGAQSPNRVQHMKQSPLSDDERKRIMQKTQKFSKNPRSRRRNILRTELGKFGLEVREDSKLCQRFIGGENISIKFIASVMQEMNYLSKHTAYDDLMHILVQSHREHCDPHHERQRESDVYAKLSVQAKHLALSQNDCCLIEHCNPDFCLGNEIGLNQIKLTSSVPMVHEYTPCSIAAQSHEHAVVATE